jgi:hypothetical protein
MQAIQAVHYLGAAAVLLNGFCSEAPPRTVERLRLAR